MGLASNYVSLKKDKQAYTLFIENTPGNTDEKLPTVMGNGRKEAK